MNAFMPPAQVPGNAALVNAQSQGLVQVQLPIAPVAAPVIAQAAQAAVPVVPLGTQGEDGRRCFTFNQVYSDEAKDPCNRSYLRIMNHFDASEPNAPTSPDLFNQVVNSGNTHLQAYLCCGTGVSNSSPRVYCIHSPMRFASALERAPSAWDNMCFTSLGEIFRGQVTNVLFHENMFEEIDVQVLTVPHILEHIEELTNATSLFSPVMPGDANTITARTQRFMYLSMLYVLLLLNAGGYTLCQVWERLYPALMQHQELELCQPLITWLQATSMGTLLVKPQAMGDPAIALPLCAPPANEALLSQQLQLLHQILSGLSAPPQTLEVTLSQRAPALINQTNDQCLVRAPGSHQNVFQLNFLYCWSISK